MEEKTKGLPRRKYDAAFKADIIKMVANGQTVPYVSKALGVSENLIYRWKSEGRDRKRFYLTFPGESAVKRKSSAVGD